MITIHTYTAPCCPGQKAYLIREAISKTPYLSNIKIEETEVEQIIFTAKGAKVKFSCNSFYQTSMKNLGKTWALSKEDAERIFNETVKRARKE